MLGNENQAVGMYGPVMLIVGNLMYRTNGYRANSHSDSDIYSALIHARVIPGLNVQPEFRRRETDIGDVESARPGGGDGPTKLMSKATNAVSRR